MQMHDLPRWHWGAFMFNVWWGLGNRTYWPLLCLLPIPGWWLIWAIVCGFKGNQWAWTTRRVDEETYVEIQLSWQRAGLWAFISAVVLGAAAGFFSLLLTALF